MNNALVITLYISLTLLACNSNSSQKKTTPQQNPNSQVETTIPTETGSSGGEIIDTPLNATKLQLNYGLVKTRSQFLQDLSVHLTSSYETLYNEAKDFESISTIHCSSPREETLELLKKSYTQFMLHWQELELFQIGALLEKNKSLKTRIYNWPTLPYLCKIDEESMYALEDGEQYSLPAEYNKIGLQAAEYLIFENKLETGCPNGATKVKWNALSLEKRSEARCAYLKAVSSDLTNAVLELKTKWGSRESNYISQKIGSQDAEQALVQELFNNILYIDIELKNKKVGAPGGEDSKACANSPLPCEKKQELLYSGLSRAAISSNIKALADLLFGFGQPKTGGLSAVVRMESGTAPSAPSQSETNLSNLVLLDESEPSSLEAIISTKKLACSEQVEHWVCKMQSSIKTLVADFKSEYAAVLRVQVPVEKQGDND